MRRTLTLLMLLLCPVVPAQLFRQHVAPAVPAPLTPGMETVLPPDRWLQVESAVDRALAWMAPMQQSDGSFPAPDGDQPGMTALCAMAFLARGHVPGDTPYGRVLAKSIDYILACQQADGLMCKLVPPDYWSDDDTSPAKAGSYSHAIAGIFLAEVYGMTSAEQGDRIRAAIEKGLDYSISLQQRPKPPHDKGGFRYVRLKPTGYDADLSITGWHLMFLRAAHNAGFSVPVQYIDEAVAYVKRCWRADLGTFHYGELPHMHSRAMAGAGIFSLALGGLHEDPQAASAARWLLTQGFDQYNMSYIASDRYHYSLYYATLGMFQMGGNYWKHFYPRIVDVLLANQGPDGAWAPERLREGFLGPLFSTCLIVNSLCVPYQLLPVYQR